MVRESEWTRTDGTGLGAVVQLPLGITKMQKSRSTDSHADMQICSAAYGATFVSSYEFVSEKPL